MAVAAGGPTQMWKIWADPRSAEVDHRVYRLQDGDHDLRDEDDAPGLSGPALFVSERLLLGRIRLRTPFGFLDLLPLRTIVLDRKSVV